LQHRKPKYESEICKDWNSEKGFAQGVNEIWNWNRDGETKGEKGNYTDLKMGSDFTRSGKRWRCRESEGAD
jgi:hypothetical protein